MPNSTTEKQWQITATIDTALCIGDSGGSETGADKATVKTSDGRLYIPASTLKGIWRHACEAIAPSMGDHSVCNSPRAENMCAKNHCIICQIFGSPTLPSRIFISDLQMDTELAAESTEIRSGVTINRQRRVAEDQRLYFTETSLPNASIVFLGDITINAKITDEQIKLLKAGLQYIHAIGSGKSRGLGWLHIEQTEQPTKPKKDSSIKQSDNDFTEINIEVTLQSPIVPGGRKSRGQAVESVQHIRGGLLRGAVANAWLADSDTGDPDADFNTLFLSDAAAIFRNCYPGTNMLPATALGCKDFSGFLTPDDKEKHGIFDTLLERLVAEEVGWLYNPSCPHCEGRVEAQSGFYVKPNDVYKKKTLNTRLLTRVAINRQRKVAADELLYHLNAIDHLSSNGEKSENVNLYGSARIPSALVSKVADTLHKRVERLGAGISRGLGRVNVNVKNQDNTDTLERRISDFNTTLQKIWNAYSRLPNVNIGTFEGTYFTVNLQSDAILTAEDGWQRSMRLTPPMLQEMASCKTDVTFVRSFASYGYAGGWNAAWKLPKETELVTNMGSVFVFHTSDVNTWLPALQKLENTGIGKRREEGFGQILICDPFHLRSREQVKSEGPWLKKEEQTQ